MGLGVNAARPGGIPVVAALPYEQDCPDKEGVQLTGPTVTAEQALALVGAEGYLFVDARPAEAFAAGHIPGARSQPLSFIAPVDGAVAAELRRHEHLIVYCDSPEEALARRLASQLAEQGLTSVKILLGGWEAFQRARGGRPREGRPREERSR